MSHGRSPQTFGAFAETFKKGLSIARAPGTQKNAAARDLSRLPRLSRTFLSFPENACLADRPQQHRSEGLIALIAHHFLGGWSIVGASHANLPQTMHPPGEQPALFLFFRTFRAERAKHQRPGWRADLDLSTFPESRNASGTRIYAGAWSAPAQVSSWVLIFP